MGLQQTNALKTVWSHPGGVVRDFLSVQGVVFGSAYRSFLKLVGIKVKFEEYQTTCFKQSRVQVLVVSSFYLSVSASCKTAVSVR